MEAARPIPEKLFFKIGEVCDLVDVQPHVLRYWESEFPMLAPQKNRAGQRVYRRKDVEIVMRIRELLYDEKFTIAGARRKLAAELRGGTSPRLKVVTPDMEAEAAPEPVPGEQRAAQVAPNGGSAGSLTPRAERTIKRIRRELEGLLTLLEADDIKPDRR
jgi:DNA-binding transcriptional MerR regulator